MNELANTFGNIASFLWGLPLVILLVGGGLFFVFHSRFMPYFYLKHAVAITTGKLAGEQKAAGELSHFQALMVALSGTLGLGNIAGVAVAITLGGAGAVFWMWVTAIVGIATKFYTATLAIQYRGLDGNGKLQGGPMYVIREGLGKKGYRLQGCFVSRPCLALCLYFKLIN